MKKIILTAAAVFAFSFANAQEAKSFGFAKGDVYVSGSISSSSETDKDSETTFAPSVGYFVSDNISLAANLAISNNGDNDKSTTIGLGAAYVFNAGNQFSSQIGLNLGFGNNDAVIDSKSTEVSLIYGINYFVSSHFALTADLAPLSYVSRKDDVAGAKAVNTTSIGVNLSNISLGLAYKF
jgi:hypothetical protein